jgi:hypothetical protein
MPQLTDEEVEALKKLIPVADQLAEEANYRAAQRLVLKTWRQTIILLSGLIAAAFILRDQLARLLGVGG